MDASVGETLARRSPDPFRPVRAMESALDSARAAARAAARSAASRLLRFFRAPARLSATVFGAFGLFFGMATYLILVGLTPLHPTRGVIWTLIWGNVCIIVGLTIVVVWQLIRIGRDRRRGMAGATLHGRLASLFAFVAAVPAVLVAVFAVLTLDRGLDAWFSDRIKSIILGTTSVARTYLDEHRVTLAHDVSMTAKDLSNAAVLYRDDPERFHSFLAAQTVVRSLPQAFVVTRDGSVLAAAPDGAVPTDDVPDDAFRAADRNGSVVFTSGERSRLVALTPLTGFGDDAYLRVARFVSPGVMRHLLLTESALREYGAMDANRHGVQVTFALVYVVLALVILLSAIWIGLAIADQLATPIARLIRAARDLGEGNAGARVKDLPKRNDDLSRLARAFNTMADRLGEQRAQLESARDELDAKVSFTETVLRGVRSGVVGVDGEGRVNHVNDVACDAFEIRAGDVVGRPVAESLPAFAALVSEVASDDGVRRRDGRIVVADARRGERILMAAVARSKLGRAGEELVITFDDVSDMLTAQKNAAWADIARRIAHEIKNPLTPIRLSAERLQERYGDAIRDDPRVFAQCTDTITRQVENIGRMVDEFSAFARMPAPIKKRFDVSDVVSQAIFLQRVANPDVAFHFRNPGPIFLVGDGRQLGQALTNLLKNAEESVREHASRDDRPGVVSVSVERRDEDMRIVVADNGPGWPSAHRHALLEPYRTSKAKGTGLGLAIVKKMIDDHGGTLLLEDASDLFAARCGAAVVMIFPARTDRSGDRGTTTREPSGRVTAASTSEERSRDRPGMSRPDDAGSARDARTCAGERLREE